jgi:hypothetical protein
LKQNNSDLTAKIFLSVVAVILVGIIIFFTKSFVNSTTEAADNVVDGTEEIASDYAEYGIKMYDGEEVRGSEVVSFIKKYLGDYTVSETSPYYVQVKTVVSGTTYTNKYVNKQYISNIKTFTSNQYYIKPTAKFSCEVIKSANKAILGVNFTQK